MGIQKQIWVKLCNCRLQVIGTVKSTIKVIFSQEHSEVGHASSKRTCIACRAGSEEGKMYVTSGYTQKSREAGYIRKTKKINRHTAYRYEPIIYHERHHATRLSCYPCKTETSPFCKHVWIYISTSTHDTSTKNQCA